MTVICTSQLQEGLAKTVLQKGCCQMLADMVATPGMSPALFASLACLIRNILTKVTHLTGPDD